MNVDLLLEKHDQIQELFHRFGDLELRIAGTSLQGATTKPDVDILLNLDPDKEEDAVVLINTPSGFVRKPWSPGPVRAVDWLDVCMYLIGELNELTCGALKITVVDRLGLDNSFPATSGELQYPD